MTSSRLPLSPTSHERERSDRLQHLPEEDRGKTAEAYFDGFDWEPSSHDPRRLTAEQFLRNL